jgi:hypothetical protein
LTQSRIDPRADNRDLFLGQRIVVRWHALFRIFSRNNFEQATGTRTPGNDNRSATTAFFDSNITRQVEASFLLTCPMALQTVPLENCRHMIVVIDWFGIFRPDWHQAHAKED